MSQNLETNVADVPIELERDVFLRTLLRELSGALQEIVGLEDAKGFISVVGTAMGRQIDDAYKNALEVENLSREQIADVLVDLKRRIKGGFYVIEQDDDRIVFGNSQCPFGNKVIGRPSLCMMTSNVFGRIAADNNGYAEVDLQETIAEGAPGCRVVVYLNPSDDMSNTARTYYPEQSSGD